MSKNYCAQTVNDECVAIIVADFDWVTANLPGIWHDLGGEPLTVAIGDIWDGTTFVKPVVSDE